MHLGEVDSRKLHLTKAYSSMFIYCVRELGFSEDSACSRIEVARLIRRLPSVLEFCRSGKVHLSGLRLLSSHLTEDNHLSVLEEASGKSVKQIQELIARIAPKPPIPDSIRKLPVPSVATLATVAQNPLIPGVTPLFTESPSVSSRIKWVETEAALPKTVPASHRPKVSPLSEETFRVQFTASKALRDKLKQAQELLGHSVPNGDLSTIVEKALDLLITDVKKKRFGVGRKPKPSPSPESSPSSPRAKSPSASPMPKAAEPRPISRHIPDAIKRAVYERDNGRCTFTDEQGRRCGEAMFLELDHVHGFAKTQEHSVEGIRLRCRGHNQLAAEQLYGKDVIQAARNHVQLTGGSS